MLQYRKDDGKTDEDSEAEYRNLDATVCSNRNLVRNNGIAKTDKNGRITFRGLKLGYKYRLTEIRPLAGTQGLENPITDIELPMLLETKSGNEIKPVAETQGRFVYVKLKYKISNNTFTMPMTSGNGFFWSGILGLIATGIGGAPPINVAMAAVPAKNFRIPFFILHTLPSFCCFYFCFHC